MVGAKPKFLEVPTCEKLRVGLRYVLCHEPRLDVMMQLRVPPSD